MNYPDPTIPYAGRNYAADRMKIVASWVEGVDVLDVGCWHGEFEDFLPEGKRVTGIDLLQDAVEDSKRHHPEHRYFRMDASSLTFTPSSFDTVVMMELIEHIGDSASLLAGIRRVLRPDGILIVSTPTTISRPQIRRILGMISRPHFRKIIASIDAEERYTGDQRDHIHEWSAYTLYRLLHRSGFSFVDCRFIRGWPFPEDMMLKVRRS